MIVDKDEHPKETTLEKLSNLPTPFKIEGTVTAGNSSGVNDGAAALIIANEKAANDNGLEPVKKLLRLQALEYNQLIWALDQFQLRKRY